MESVAVASDPGSRAFLQYLQMSRGYPTKSHRMNQATLLPSSVCYSGTEGSATWEGHDVEDDLRFNRYLRDVVSPRIAGSDNSFESTLLGLATTGMETEFVGRLLNATSEPKSWEIGEALAECLLRDGADREVHWPWNTVRDRRTPRASLPGADLVGFQCEGDAVLLLFGEVKTSSDRSTPPSVMNGGSGMAWQLERSASQLDVQRSLLQWLYARCATDLHLQLYEKAVARYLSSEGTDFLLVGVLIRDTEPSELDLKARGRSLAAALPQPTRIELVAWYLPVRIAKWPEVLQGITS